MLLQNPPRSLIALNRHQLREKDSRKDSWDPEPSGISRRGNPCLIGDVNAKQLS
jgi:hypothetical protein